MLNKGISFGLFPGISVGLIAIVWLIFLSFTVTQLHAGKMRELSSKVGSFLILLGGAGNIMSRIVDGGVVDNLNIYGIMHNNVWDYMIGAGVLIWLYHEYR